MTDFEIIENYLKGNLKGEELSSFEERLATDSQFSSEVERHKKVQELVLLKGLLETRGKLDEIRRIKNAKPNGSSNHWGKIFLLGISAVLIGGLFLWLNKKENKLEKQTLATSVENKNNSNEANQSSEDLFQKPEEEKAKNRRREEKQAKNDSISEVEESKAHADPIPAPSKDDTTSVLPASKPKETSNTGEYNPCKSVSIQSKINSEESCMDKPTGKISLSSITGGTSPYKISFNNSGFSSREVFVNVGEGKHWLTIQDAKGCTQAFEVEVSGKECFVEKPAKFSPDLGETWEYPVDPGANAKVRLYDAAGSVVFETTISGGYPKHWDGIGNNGSYIKAGAYIYQIINGNGTIKEGSVTIVR